MSTKLDPITYPAGRYKCNLYLRDMKCPYSGSRNRTGIFNDITHNVEVLPDGSIIEHSLIGIMGDEQFFDTPRIWECDIQDYVFDLDLSLNSRIFTV